MAPGAFAHRLGADPLGDSADPRLYVPREDTDRALAALEAYLEASEGAPRAALLCGPSGLGKTLLLRVLEARAAATRRVFYSPFLHLGPADASEWLLEGLGVRGLQSDAVDGVQADARDTLAGLLRAPCDPPLLLIVDEIQSIPPMTAAFLGRILEEVHPRHRVVLAGVEGASLRWVARALRIEVHEVRLAAPLDQAELRDLLEAALAHGRFDESARSLLARSDPDALLDAAAASPQGLKSLLVQASRGRLPGPLVARGADGSPESMGSEAPLQVELVRLPDDPPAQSWTVRAAWIVAALGIVVADAQRAFARGREWLAIGRAHARRGVAIARERVGRFDGECRAAWRRARHAWQRLAADARSAARRGRARAGEQVTAASDALLDGALRFRLRAARFLAGAGRRLVERARTDLVRLAASGRTLRARLGEAGTSVRGVLLERGARVRRGLVDGGRIVRGALVDGGRIVRGALVDGGRIVRGALVDGGRIVRGVLIDGGRIVRGALVDGGRIVRGALVDGGRIVRGALVERGGSLRRRLSLLGRLVAEHATEARRRLAAGGRGLRRALGTAAADGRQIRAESMARLRPLVAEHGAGVRATLLTGIALGPLLAFGPHGAPDAARAPERIEQPAGALEQPDVPARVSAAPGPPRTEAAAAATITIHVNARPWANIWLDGRDLGTTPLSHDGLEPGSYRMEARFPDGKRMVRSVAIGPEARRFSFP